MMWLAAIPGMRAESRTRTRSDGKHTVCSRGEHITHRQMLPIQVLFILPFIPLG